MRKLSNSKATSLGKVINTKRTMTGQINGCKLLIRKFA